jgi:hypothetical protein
MEQAGRFDASTLVADPVVIEDLRALWGDGTA